MNKEQYFNYLIVCVFNDKKTKIAKEFINSKSTIESKISSLEQTCIDFKVGPFLNIIRNRKISIINE